MHKTGSGPCGLTCLSPEIWATGRSNGIDLTLKSKTPDTTNGRAILCFRGGMSPDHPFLPGVAFPDSDTSPPPPELHMDEIWRAVTPWVSAVGKPSPSGGTHCRLSEFSQAIWGQARLETWCFACLLGGWILPHFTLCFAIARMLTVSPPFCQRAHASSPGPSDCLQSPVFVFTDNSLCNTRLYIFIGTRK